MSFRKRLSVLIVSGVLLTGTCVFADGIIPSASNWTASTSLITDRNGNTGTSSISDITNGVELGFAENTGGEGVGTSTLQWDYTTTANASGSLDLNFDVNYSAFLGFDEEWYGLQIIQNGNVVDDLISYQEGNPVSLAEDFENVILNLTAGDTWGIRLEGGNYTACCGVSGTVDVTEASPVPEPGSVALLGVGLIGLAAIQFRRKGVSQ